MSDETPTPVEQAPSGGSQQQAAPSSSNNVDWKARFDGQVRKIEELTLRNRELEGQLAATASEAEQLRAQLSQRDADKSAMISERDKTVQELTQTMASNEGELKRLRGLELKVKVAREMGRPDLMRVLDAIPNVNDEAVLKTVLESLSDYADNAVREREKQLLSGLTPPITSGGANGTSTPSSESAWQDHINGMPIGSPERAKAHDDYWNWLVAKHQNQ